MLWTYDAIVVGAGPAGSTAARLMARAGAKVLLLDRARFPREKPCGGGITYRAETACDVDLSPPTEREIYGVRISVKLGGKFERRSPRLLARMTQRSRLDEYLVQQASSAGVRFQDGAAVREIELAGATATVHVEGDAYQADVLIGADGINGATARAVGLAPAMEAAVALEANVPVPAPLMDRRHDSIGLDLGGIPGGYGWVFPKGDHLNIGVGGWMSVGPTLRSRLSALCAYYRFDESTLFDVRGYRLPLRDDRARLVHGPVMLTGDAAALVDPLSGEGIWAAFLSARLAAEHAVRYLHREAGDLRGYDIALRGVMDEEILASRRLQAVFQRLPSAAILMLKYNDSFWRYLTEIIRGEITYPDLPKKLGFVRYALNAWGDAEIALHRRQLRRARRHNIGLQGADGPGVLNPVQSLDSPTKVAAGSVDDTGESAL